MRPRNKPLTDTEERRRVQNRLAQRKWRQRHGLKKQNEPSRCSTTTIPSNPTLASGHDGLQSTSCSIAPTTDIDLSAFGNEVGSDDLSKSFPAAPVIDDQQLWDPETFRPLTWRAASPVMDVHTLSSIQQGGDEESLWAVESEPCVAKDDSATISRPPPRRSRGRANSVAVIGDWINALHIAAEKGHNRILIMLLERHVFGVDDPDGEGKTALQHATAHEHEACVRTLLAHGAEVDRPDRLTGWTSLHWANLTQNEPILRMLLDSQTGKSDFNIDCFDIGGWTSLHVAIDRGFEPGVNLLTEHGADIAFAARRCITTGVIHPREIEDLRRLQLLELVN